MATKKEIRHYAEANGITREEARQHFINEAKNRNNLNEEKVVEMLEKTSDTLIEFEPTIGYADVNNAMMQAAKSIINKFPTLIEMKNRKALKDLSLKMTGEVNEEFGINVFDGPLAATQNPDVIFKSAGVPQKKQVMIGLLDLIGGLLHIKCNPQVVRVM